MITEEINFMKIVVVTACLAGIAHSKIVAEALTKEGKKKRP